MNFSTGSEKIYYTISEVAEQTDLPAHTIRYWEKVFSTLRPSRDRGGRRRYRDEDIKLILQIQELVHGEHYSLNGATKRLSELKKGQHKLRNIHQLKSVISDIEIHANNLARMLNIK